MDSAKPGLVRLSDCLINFVGLYVDLSGYSNTAPSTLTHTHTVTFSSPLPVDFTNTHVHERSLKEVNYSIDYSTARVPVLYDTVSFY